MTKELTVPCHLLRIIVDGHDRAMEPGVTAADAIASVPSPGTEDPLSASPSPEVELRGSDRAADLAEVTRDVRVRGKEAVVAARVNGQLRDLFTLLQDGDSVEPVRMGSPDGLAILRHSTAHVMAQAVQGLFPEAKLGIGPPIENGFYYDFDVPKPFDPDDLKIIEDRMQEIVQQGQLFQRRVVAEDEARSELADEPYKLELIGLKGKKETGAESVEVGGSELTIYDNLNAATGDTCWKDLCRGPHLPATINIPAFKLMRSGGAYWRGSEQNPQLQRIYGTAWPSSREQKDYLNFLAEAERRDHRRIGAELDLFSFPAEIGTGLAVFHPKGATVRTLIEAHSRRKHEQAGYQFVTTPHIAKSTLFETSGHLGWYADSMFPPLEMEGSEYYLKPMNCPFHIQVFKSRGRSYRELPLRLFEFGTVYRYEKSGVLHGLTRVRGFTQDDSHIFCTPEQLPEELISLLDFVIAMLRDFGLTEFEAELATRPEKSAGDTEQWDEARQALLHALEVSRVPYVVAEGEGAFYAPKIDVHVRDAIGRRWQLATLQVDLQLPVRFDLEYQGSDGLRHRPCMIHRTILGSLERFFGILLEHYVGALPPWLAPVQVICIPITSAHVPYVDAVADQLRAQGIRVEVDAGDERMQKKIRNAQQQKVPYMLLAGDEDIAKGAVSFRYRNGQQRNGVPVAEAAAEILDAVTQRIQV